MRAAPAVRFDVRRRASAGRDGDVGVGGALKVAFGLEAARGDDVGGDAGLGE